VMDGARVWVADQTGKNRRRVASGVAIDWLDAGRHVLIYRSGGTPTAPSSRLFRLDVDPAQERSLGGSPGHSLPGEAALSRGRQWLAMLETGTLSLLSTNDGRRLSLPIRDVSHFFWGASDRVLFVWRAGSWQRAVIAIGPTGRAASASWTRAEWVRD